jgi:hypothetical protein
VPAAKYAPWFGVPLKCARLAVKVLQLLSLEARASKLSFNDVVKKLAAQEETAPTFVSKKVRVALLPRYAAVPIVACSCAVGCRLSGLLCLSLPVASCLAQQATPAVALVRQTA